MKKQTAELITDFNHIKFWFHNICDDYVVCGKYQYVGSQNTFNFRRRKIYKDKEGTYFMFQRYKVRFKNEL